MISSNLIAKGLMMSASLGFKHAKNLSTYKSGQICRDNANAFEGAFSSVSKFLAYKGAKQVIGSRNEGLTALDYGCGLGDSTQFISSFGFKTIGVDHDPNMIQQAIQKKSGIPFRQVFGSSLPFKDNTFDLVYSSFVVLEMPNASYLEKYFSAAHRVLKPGGRMVILTSNPEIYNPDRTWLALKPWVKNQLMIGSKVKVTVSDIDTTFEDYYWTEEELTLAAESAGFNVKHAYYPLGDELDNIEWKDEWEHSTNLVLELTK